MIRGSFVQPGPVEGPVLLFRRKIRSDVALILFRSK